MRVVGSKQRSLEGCRGIFHREELNLLPTSLISCYFARGCKRGFISALQVCTYIAIPALFVCVCVCWHRGLGKLVHIHSLREAKSVDPPEKIPVTHSLELWHPNLLRSIPVVFPRPPPSIFRALLPGNVRWTPGLGGPVRVLR